MIKYLLRVWQCSHFLDDAIPFWITGWLCWILFFQVDLILQTHIITVIKLLKAPLLNTILDTMPKLTENCVSMFYTELELAFVSGQLTESNWIFLFFCWKLDFILHSFGVAFAWTHLTICSNFIILHLILFTRFEDSEMEKMNVWCAMVKQFVEWWQCMLFDLVTLLGLAGDRGSSSVENSTVAKDSPITIVNFYLCDTNI